MYRQGIFPIQSILEIANGFYDLQVDISSCNEIPKPGQFVNIFCGTKTLRRPISVCDFDKEKKLLRLVFEIRGEGTAWLSRQKPGAGLDLLLPLGNGFRFADTNQKVVFIGGGIGTPPLLYGCRQYGKNADAILGFRTREAAILIDDFRSITNQTLISTDDGTLEHHGLVTDLLQQRLQQERCDAIYACGPKPMLKGIALLAEQYGVSCQVSLEERMGCGIGACLVCACKTKTQSGETYSHVCKDGPVYDAKEVVW